ncbi:hypothetical protein FA95DRAFT_1329285 [Auriscalpium vulgare]|uniref:Uncharacterized protein n=1 Tax=Auriscalpium vulgare TaxID=40419 RepID=A0ACB8S7C4_9AGAM|nr:hypothetical protein FA95DRAFT_1329285 [Auriscalpium vulgare]
MPPPPLPFDIHARIIQYVYIISQTHDVDYPTLSACALVCKDWVAPSQRLLFRRIVRHSMGDGDSSWFRRVAPLLLRAFASRPHLGTYVRFLTIGTQFNYVQFNHLPDNLDDTLVLPLLRCCPHIALLSIVGTSVPNLQGLRALDLRPSVLVFSASIARDAVHTVLQVLPSVRHVVMELGGGLAPPPTSRLLSVKSGNTIDVGRLPEGILFEDLDLHYLFFSENMTSIEHAVASNLRALTTWVVPSSFTLERLTALETLILIRLPSPSVTLPRTLRHFGFHADNGSTPPGMAQSLKDLGASLSKSALPTLRVVSVTRCSHPSIRRTLERVCTARGAEFVEYVDREAYPRPRYVDWIW